MATSFYPATSTDDGYVYTFLGAFYNSNTYIDFGINSIAFVRFQNVTIPQGSSISSCILRFVASDNNSGACSVNIYFNDVDDAVAPTDTAGVNALVLTDPVAWNSIASWTATNSYDSVDISSILQDIVDRVGWASGQAVLVKLVYSTGSGLREPRSIDYDSGSAKAQLIVEWGSADNTGDVDVTFPVITNTGYTGGHSALTFPLATLAATTPYTGSELTFPLLTLEAGAGALATNTFPLVTISATGQMTFVGHVDITLPFLTLEGTNIEGGNLAVSFPKLVSNIRAGLRCTLTLPAQTITAHGVRGFFGRLNSSLPSLRLTIIPGINGSITFPIWSDSATGLQGFVGKGSITFPKFSLSFNALQELIARGRITLPITVISSNGKQSISCRCTVKLRLLRVVARGYAGNLGVGINELPSIEIEIEGFDNPVGEIEEESGMFSCSATGYSNNKDEVLRYNREVSI